MTTGCIGALGSGPVGAMPVGSGYALAILSVREETLNSVIVEFSDPPRSNDASDVHDAMNPDNWTLSVRQPATARVRLVQTVEFVDDLHVRVLFDGELSAQATYRLTASTMIADLSGGPISAVCDYGDFDTFSPARFPLPAAAMEHRSVDFANPFLQRDAPGPNSPLGTYQIDDTGDIGRDEGRANLRKRILRRATTMMGAFFHLAGYGASPRLKSLIRAGSLSTLENALTRQIKLEPDVKTVQVSVGTILTKGGTIVRVTIRVTDSFGDVEPVIADLPVG